MIIGDTIFRFFFIDAQNHPTHTSSQKNTINKKKVNTGVGSEKALL